LRPVNEKAGLFSKLFCMKLLLSILAALLLAGCSETPKRHYDGHALLKRKCSACHNLDMPPKTYENETAPPMMAVVFHVRDFMKVDNPSEKRENSSLSSPTTPCIRRRRNRSVTRKAWRVTV